jgi:hypothetical protein
LRGFSLCFSKKTTTNLPTEAIYSNFLWLRKDAHGAMKKAPYIAHITMKNGEFLFMMTKNYLKCKINRPQIHKTDISEEPLCLRIPRGLGQSPNLMTGRSPYLKEAI